MFPRWFVLISQSSGNRACIKFFLKMRTPWESGCAGLEHWITRAKEMVRDSQLRQDRENEPPVV